MHERESGSTHRLAAAANEQVLDPEDVKIGKLLFIFLFNSAKLAFVHWVWRTRAVSCVEESTAQVA